MRILMAAASAAALAFAGGALAQDDEEDAGPDAGACGQTFASSGAASSAAYAGGQLLACDALLDGAGTAAELLAARETMLDARQNLLERWQAVNQELLTVAAEPAPPAPEDPNVPVNDPWANKLAERHAVEVATDGLRILMRLAYQLETNFADPAKLAAGLEGPAAARVGEILQLRDVCAGSTLAARGNTPAMDPSWYAFTELFSEEGDGSILYEAEVRDEMAEIAEAYVTTELRTAPSLGVTELESFSTRTDCIRREFPSQRPAT